MNESKSLLQNESSFDRLFCDFFPNSNYSIYYNSNFSDDPIFNHTRISDSILESDDYPSDKIESILDSLLANSENFGVPASIYVERIWRNSQRFEGDSIAYGFRIIEQMEILTKKVERSSEESDRILVEQTRDADAWERAFAKSFGIPQGWHPELDRRTRDILYDKSTVLMIAREDDIQEASGCLLLHQTPEDLLGIYCVGTIPERRSRGIAKSMMIKAQNLAFENNCKLVLLQTVKSDGVTSMYVKMGFQIDFQRDVLQFQIV